MNFEITKKEDKFFMEALFGNIMLYSVGYTIPQLFENMADIIRQIESSTNVKISI